MLFSVLVTGLMINPSNIIFAQTQGNSTNSTSITLNETKKLGDGMVNPDDVLEQDNSTITLNETMKLGDGVVNPSDEMTTSGDTPVVILSPLKQIKDGVMSKDVICKDGLELAFKFNGQAACVKVTSIEKLVTRGWTQ